MVVEIELALKRKGLGGERRVVAALGFERQRIAQPCGKRLRPGAARDDDGSGGDRRAIDECDQRAICSRCDVLDFTFPERATTGYEAIGDCLG